MTSRTKVQELDLDEEFEPFPPGSSLGEQAPEVVVAFLREIGNHEAADNIAAAGGTGQGFLGFGNSPYTATGVAYGLIDDDRSGSVSRVLTGNRIAADPSLAGTRIKVTLDHFYAAEYPGRGKQSILCEFQGKNQIAGSSEPIHFAATLTVQNQDSAGITGLPLFLGLTVGKNGIQLSGRTVYVGSTSDDALMGIFDSEIYKKGLSLLSTAQPALAPLALTAGGVIKFLINGPKNQEVHQFKMGFDFTGSKTSPRLRLGSYIVAQGGDQSTIPLSSCVWDNERSRLYNQRTGKEVTEFNYMVFGISSFDEEIFGENRLGS
ncbi:hypothetical protein [uncultured Aureimonas sp.]|uniref:hypothetical protein n=1 Tax=uncultured Aureimonas sp. TaxID=1604662 RepID=UPI0025FB115E|nr:hypothetical protein [uncultured Aureimonas sp.]